MKKQKSLQHQAMTRLAFQNTWTERAHTPTWNPLGISLSVEARPGTNETSPRVIKTPVKLSIVTAALILAVIALTITLIWF